MVKEFNEEREKILRIAKEFGDKIKKLRVDKKFGLREFAGKVGLSPTYLSKMERGLDPPPSPEKILKMARELGCDENELFALAKKLPLDFKEAFTKSKVYAKKVPEFLRSATEANLTEADWDRLIKELKNIKSQEKK